jgi:hypothetical protein
MISFDRRPQVARWADCVNRTIEDRTIEDLPRNGSRMIMAAAGNGWLDGGGHDGKLQASPLRAGVKLGGDRGARLTAKPRKMGWEARTAKANARAATFEIIQFLNLGIGLLAIENT